MWRLIWLTGYMYSVESGKYGRTAGWGLITRLPRPQVLVPTS
jgi:hypothetical protein